MNIRPLYTSKCMLQEVITLIFPVILYLGHCCFSIWKIDNKLQLPETPLGIGGIPYTCMGDVELLTDRKDKKKKQGNPAQQAQRNIV